MFTLCNQRYGNTGAMQTLPRAAGTAYFRGEMLTYTAGALSAATGGAKPMYLCLDTRSANDGVAEIHVLPVTENQCYQTQFAVSAASVNVGDAVTLDTTGGKVTATTTDGVFTITQIVSDAQGGTVCGIFR